MYKDALATLQRKFGQPHAIVGAHLGKLNTSPPFKMHNSEAVFKSLSFNQAVSKLPPNLKED